MNEKHAVAAQKYKEQLRIGTYAKQVEKNAMAYKRKYKLPNSWADYVFDGHRFSNDAMYARLAKASKRPW
jgi:hypothetical protein